MKLKNKKRKMLKKDRIENVYIGKIKCCNFQEMID